MDTCMFDKENLVISALIRILKGKLTLSNSVYLHLAVDKLKRKARCSCFIIKLSKPNIKTLLSSLTLGRQPNCLNL